MDEFLAFLGKSDIRIAPGPLNPFSTDMMGLPRAFAFTIPFALAFTQAIGVTSALPLSAQSPVPDGAAIYRDACANCHGQFGTGDQQTQIALEVEIPDFTDCNFATREAAADWFAVVHEGGPVRGFSEVMPAFGDALSDAEIEAVVSYVLTLCEEEAWPRGELNLPRALVTEKAYPEDEAVISTSVATDELGGVMSELIWERRIGARTQLELVIPVGFQERPESEGGWTGGRLGDIAVGLKRTLFHSMASGSIVSAAAEVLLPTGGSDDGTGTGTLGFEPFISAGQILPYDGFLQLQLGAEFFLDRDRAEPEAFWRGALGKTFTQGPFGRAWSPMVELLGGRELESGAPTEWDLVPQLQATLNVRQHFVLSGGVRIPLTDTDQRKPAILAYLLWDWFDGGMFDGW